MTTAKIPPEAQTDAEDHLYKMAEQSMTALQHKAWVAGSSGKGNTEIVLVCVQVDSEWRYLVEKIMPEEEERWSTLRNRGLDPVALGVYQWDLCKEMAEKFPEIKYALLEIPPPGKYKCIFLNFGMCASVNIEPKSNTKVLC